MDALDLVIVGAGPVGLVAGLEAAAAGLNFVVLERDSVPRQHSRAIGIHPPALRRLARVDPKVADALIEVGTRIRRGHGMGMRRHAMREGRSELEKRRRGPSGSPGERGGSTPPPRPIGTMDFALLGAPFDYILTLQQWRTEAILEAALQARAPGALRRGVEVTGLRRVAGGVTVVEANRLHRKSGGSAGNPELGAMARASTGIGLASAGKEPTGESASFRTPLVIACDGKGSLVRQLAGIGYRGGGYGARYMMGDFPTVGLAAGVPGFPEGGPLDAPHDAFLFLAREGLVESFPLPGWEEEVPVRRWVAELSEGCHISPVGLGEVVERRCDVQLDAEACRWFSTFEAERFMADTFVGDGVILAGDAAHIVSPIGGQGMNLGWLNTGELIETIAAGGELRSWEAKARRRALRATRRAEQNMLLANRLRRGWVAAARETVLRLALATPLEGVLARRFSMTGL